MSNMNIDVTAIPEKRRNTYREFAQLLAALAGDNLLGLCGFGGWVVDDPCYADAPASSVLVLRRVDLTLLDELARRGSKFGRQRIAAPLIMMPEYIEASCDVFPLELLEIQQLHARISGEDHFPALTFARTDLRLQCERELKVELMQLRQGLIAAAGRHKLLHELCVSAAERTMRIVRGVLHLLGKEAPPLARDVLETTAEVTGVNLVTLARALLAADRLDFADFRRCYAEAEALAAYVDKFDDAAGQ